MIIKKSFFHTISKFMICLLCCFMLFSLISKPIIAQASVTAVAIGAYGVIKVVMSAKVLVGLIIGSFTGFAMSILVPDMDDWYDSDPVVRNWADQYNGAISGGEVISIPSEVQDSIRSRFDVSSSINISTLYVPYDLTHLEKVSAAHIFGTDVAAQLEANNTLLQQANMLLSDLIGAFNAMSTSFSTALENIKTSFSAEFTQFKQWYVNINDTLKEEIHQIPKWLSSINTNMKNELGQLKTWSSSINSTIKNEILGVKTNLVQIKESILNDLTKTINNLTSTLEAGISRIESKIDSIVKAESDFAQPPSSGGSGDSGNTVNSGVNNGLALFGQSNGILAGYTQAFLAACLIFNLFADISFFNKLLIVSASIGLVGVFLGLALNGAQADSAARKEAEREAKREAYRQSRYKRKGG